MSKVRQNYWAILTAAAAYFLLEAVWFTVFMDAWLEGIGRTRASLMGAAAANPGLQYGTAFLGTVAIAAAISCVTQLTGPHTALRGVRVGALLWLGFVFTTWATEYVFEARSITILAINTGVHLAGMAMAGAIVGGWKKT